MGFRLGKRRREALRVQHSIRAALNLAYWMADEPMRCHWCRTPMPSRRLTVDHIVPRWQGGAHSASNCVFACEPCNSGRDGWAQYRAGKAKRPPCPPSERC